MEIHTDSSDVQISSLDDMAIVQIFAQKDQAEYEFVGFFDDANRFLRRHCINSVVQVLFVIGQHLGA
jgi:hypothetical protein